jgi:hypothetical protein
MSAVEKQGEAPPKDAMDKPSNINHEKGNSNAPGEKSKGRIINESYNLLNVI